MTPIYHPRARGSLSPIASPVGGLGSPGIADSGEFRALFSPNILTLALQRGIGDPSSAIRSSTAQVLTYNGPDSRTYTEVPIDEHRVQGARYAGGTWYDTDGSGVQLHPYTYKNGVNWYETYPARADSTAYVLDDTRHWGGYYAKCTQAGTSAASAPAISSIGETVADGTAQWEVLGYYQDDFGLLVEGATTNYITNSNDFSSGSWAKAGSSSVTGTNQVNLPTEGDNINTICSVGEKLNRTFTYQAKLSGSGTVTLRLRDNFTGPPEAFDKLITLTSTPTIYTLTATFTTSGGGLRAFIWRQPGQTATTVNAFEAMVEELKVPSSYIPTAGSTVTRATEDGNISWPRAGNFNQSQGMLLFDWRPGYSSSDMSNQTFRNLFGVKDTASGILYDNRSAGGAGQIVSTDGSNYALIPLGFVKHAVYRFALRWNAATSKYQMGYRDLSGGGSWQWSSESTYDGAFPVDTVIRLFYSNSFVSIMRNCALFDLDQGRTWLEANY